MWLLDCIGLISEGMSAGSSGKTTTAWLIRGIFEEWGKLTGMASSIEDALYADKLNKEGDLWAPDEPDPTLDRSAPCKFTNFMHMQITQLLSNSG